MKKLFVWFVFTLLGTLLAAACAFAADPVVATVAPSGVALGIAWITANWVGIVAAFGGVVTAFSLIAKLTPTQTDDEWVAKLTKVVDFLALNTPRTGK